MKVRCIDNTLLRDVLDVGRVYEVASVNERYQTYCLVGFEDKNFTAKRFVKVESEQ